VHRPSLLGAVVLVVNLLVVGFLAYLLWRQRRGARSVN
jgi:hypothetical protein